MTDTQLVATQVDPRDILGEVDHPTYRVYFVGPSGATDEWRLQECRTVEDALSWARADGRSFDFYVEFPTPGGLGLVQLIHAHRV
jgi:hypothetical protein